MEYYQQYYIARLDEPTEPMMIGKIFQKAWCDPKYPYERELNRLGFTSEKTRVIKTALEHPALIKSDTWQTEYRIDVAPVQYRAKEFGLTYPIMGSLDGYDRGVVLENKIGYPWNQQRADESTQITWYSILVYVKHGIIPNSIIQSVNGKHGIPALFKTKRTKKQLKEMVEEINSMVAFLEAGDFNQY